MGMNEESIKQALSQVKYPGYSRDIVSFGLIQQISVGNGAVSVHIQLTGGTPEVAHQIQDDCEKVLKGLEGIENVYVQISRPAGGSPAGAAGGAFTGQRKVPGVRHIIAVASGKGGVGKSTVSVNLACALKHQGARVGLLDCDIYGPSIPLMMGCQDKPEVTSDEMLIPVPSHGIRLMSMGFLLEGDTPVIWRGPMIQKTIQQFIGQVAWGELDYLLVDLPPGTGDAQLSLCQTVPLSGGVIVTTPQEASVGVVRKGMAMFEKVHVPILGMVENMSYFTAPGGERIEIFGHGGGRAEAERKGIPFLGEVPIYTSIREGGDKGLPVVAADPTSEPALAFLEIAANLASGMDA